MVDEISELSKKIDMLYLKDKEFIVLPLDIETDLIKLIKENNSLEKIDEYISKIFSNIVINSKLDSRIEDAIEIINNIQVIGNNLYEVIPRKVYLSKSRFFHLFKEVMGIDFKNYLLLKRLEKVYFYVVKNNKSLTDAAILAGFSSSSHFSSACKKSFGISLSQFLKSQNSV